MRMDVGYRMCCGRPRECFPGVDFKENKQHTISNLIQPLIQEECAHVLVVAEMLNGYK
jgi:hypothetical protein